MIDYIPHPKKNSMDSHRSETAMVTLKFAEFRVSAENSQPCIMFIIKHGLTYFLILTYTGSSITNQLALKPMFLNVLRLCPTLKDLFDMKYGIK